MFETFLTLLLVSAMISVKCNPIVIREDRVYRYVGNDSTFQTKGLEEDFENNNKTSDQQIISDENIPESLLIRLKDVKNVSDFISNFLMEDNERHKDIYLNYLERGLPGLGNQSKEDINLERSKLMRLPKIGSPAGCVPQMQIIELNGKEAHNELHFPSCIRVSRCSGCCPSQRLQCVPINTSFDDITVIRVKYQPFEKRLKFNGFKVFRIERHEKCSCDCIQKSNDCSAYQIYSESECRCLCANTSAMRECQQSYDKYWDHNRCLCKCKSIPFCSTGLFFNNKTCRCELEEFEELKSSHIETSTDSESEKSIQINTYIVDRRIDSEIEVQNRKGLDQFKVIGINPDINEEYQENNGSLL